jgi:hypothetical protein
MAMEMLLRRMNMVNVTVHGFRSAFRDWAGNETNFARELAEAALAHVMGIRRNKLIGEAATPRETARADGGVCADGGVGALVRTGSGRRWSNQVG